MKMQSAAIIIAICIISMTGLARTPAETNAVVHALMECAMCAPEMEDNIDVSATNIVEVAFPTYDSLFQVHLQEGMPGADWSASERRKAFEAFIGRIANGELVSFSAEEENDAADALFFCCSHGYSNCLATVNALVHSPERKWKSWGYEVFHVFAPASNEMTAFVESVTTNLLANKDIERNDFHASYARKLTAAHNSGETAIATNGMVMLYRNFSDGAGGKALDVALLTAFPAYETSSNRLFVATESLGWRHAVPSVKRYFNSVTNRLHSLPQPLPEVPELRP